MTDNPAKAPEPEYRCDHDYDCSREDGTCLGCGQPIPAVPAQVAACVRCGQVGNTHPCRQGNGEHYCDTCCPAAQPVSAPSPEACPHCGEPKSAGHHVGGYCYCGDRINQWLLIDAAPSPEIATQGAPDAWQYVLLVDKHLTGQPLPGEIQIDGVWGNPGSVQVSVEEPFHRFLVEKTPLYAESALRTARDEAYVAGLLKECEARKQAEEALRKIADWELPSTGETWPSGGPVSYEANFGSNGVRDYIRSVARKALEPVSGSPERLEEQL